MRPKTSGSDARGSAAGGEGGGLLRWGGVLWRWWCPWRASLWMGARWCQPGVASGSCRGGKRVRCPPSRLHRPHTHSPPLVSREVKFGAFRGSGVLGPLGRGGARPQRLGGGGGGRAPARRRGARDWEGLGGGAGPAKPGGQRRRPSAPVLGHEHLAARCDLRRDLRATWAHRGSVCPSCPAWQQRLMPQPILLHLWHDGAPCSKQSAP